MLNDVRWVKSWDAHRSSHKRECQANAAKVCGVCDVKLTKGRFELEQWQWKDEKERRCKQCSQKMEDEIKSIVIGIAEEKIPNEDLFKQLPLNEERPIF
jgi:hypothetical protein